MLGVKQAQAQRGVPTQRITNTSLKRLIRLRFEFDEENQIVDFYIPDDSGYEHHWGLDYKQAQQLAKDILRVTKKWVRLLSLADYQKQITRTDCRCGFIGLDKLPIECHVHSGGWEVDGFLLKQWLYVTCPKCEYQWALWKLGVKRR